MRRLLGIKLRVRFLIMTLVLVGVVVTESGLVARDSLAISSHASQLAAVNIPILNKAHELKLAVIQVQQWLTDIGATRGRDGLDDGFDEASKNAASVRRLIAELQQLDGSRATQYQAMLPAFESYYAAGKEMAQAYIDQGPEGGNRIMGHFDSEAARIAGQVNSYLADVEAEAAAALATQQQLASSSGYLVSAGSAVVLLVIGLVYFSMARALAYMPRVVAALQRVAEGDLTQEISSRRQDEIGELLRGLQSMQQRLQATISEIRSMTEQLSNAADEVSVVAAHSSSSVQRQETEMQQLAAAITEMSATTRDVAENVGQTAAATKGANGQVESGLQEVQQTVAAIQRLADQIGQASEALHHLSQDSENIETVLNVITSIAEQTNLLALNAAIESARAGEHGRGFAVVANEVRTLAARTQESTESIKQIITNLQNDCRHAVTVMASGRQQVNNVVTEAQQAGTSLQAISAAVGHIDQMSVQIATATEQQHVVAEDMNRNVNLVRDMSTQNADGAVQAADAGQELARMAAELNTLLGRFKVAG